MADVTKKGTIQFKRKTATEWAAQNPILMDGEPGVERGSNPRKWKQGDGITPWNDLPYQPTGTGTGGVDNETLTAALAGKADAADVNSKLALKADAAAVQTSLSTKVSNADLTTALANKADTSALNAGLAAKANVADLNAKADAAGMATALAAKADTTAMNTQLALKVDKTSYNAAMALKADEASVTSRLAAKVDTSALTTALAGKADTSALAAKADTSALATKADTATVNAALATKVSKTEATYPIEVELVPNVRPKGKISTTDGSLIASTVDEHTGMIKVTPGETLLITFRSNEVDPSPPAKYAGVAGYATNNYNSFLATKVNGLPIGNVFDVNRYNAESVESVSGHVNFVNVLRVVPQGVEYIDASSLLETDGSGVTLSIKAIRNIGTLAESTDQLYDKVIAQAVGSGNGGSGASSNQFTDAEKQKLAAIPMPVVGWQTKGIGNAQEFIGVDDGQKYLVFVRGGNLIVEGNTKTLRSLPYRVGYSYDKDKDGASGYVNAVADARWLTPENGMTTGHVQPSLKTGFTKFVPGANSLNYDWAEADAVCQKAITLGDCKIHGAHLTWHQIYNPASPTSVNKQHVLDIITQNPGNEKAAVSAYFQEIIPVIIKHFEDNFPGLVIGWNVMNEAIDDAGNQVASVFAPYFTLDEWAEMACTAACGASLTCKFFINGYNYETGNENRIDKTISIINTLAAKNIIAPNGRKVQFDGIGSQMHSLLAIGERASAEAGYGIVAFRDKLARLASTGLLILISELDITTSGTYDDVLLARQANSFKQVFLTYERAVPPAQRWGVIMWTVGDKVFIKNIGKGYTGWDGANPATEFPAIYDWNYVAKPAKAAILSILDRPEITADVWMDFMVAPVVTDIVTSAFTTGGNTPLIWKKAGYTAGNIGVNDTGMQAKQTSQNSRTTVYVDYPYPNRTVAYQLYNIASMGTRTGMLFFKYQDEDNNLRIQVNNTTDTWSIIKRVTGSDNTLFNVPQKPTKGDIVRFTYVSGAIVCYINDINVWEGTDTTFNGITKFGIGLKGYDDKFTSIDNLYAHKI